MKLAAEQKFAQWTLKGEKPLGKGGNGVVWEAESPVGQKVAIKFLQSQHFGGQKENRFRDEIEFLKNEANQHGILPLIDFNLPDVSSKANRPWFVTPLAIPFSTLDLSGSTNLSELVRLIEIVSQNLSILHNESKWHRDLKPENLFKLDNVPLIGDFGLVDFPDKTTITGGSQILGPLFYIAPEMMENTGNIEAGPADVYSLAKTLWVMASGHHYPLQGEQRMDSAALRLSTYCRHENAHFLDSLMERSTTFEPARRPTMKEFSKELSEWLKIGTSSLRVVLDLSTLARECRGIFEPAKLAELNQKRLIQEAESALVSFDNTLERISTEIQKVTNLNPKTSEAYSLYERFHFVEGFGGARLIWRRAREVRITTKIDIIEVFFHGFVLVEALSDNQLRVLVGYLSQPIIHGHIVMTKDSWKEERIAPTGSAQLTNDVRDLQTIFLENLPQALREYVMKIKQHFKGF